MRKRKPANMVSQINLSIDHEDVLDDEEFKIDEKKQNIQKVQMKMSEDSFFNDTVEEMDFDSYNVINASI